MLQLLPADLHESIHDMTVYDLSWSRTATGQVGNATANLRLT